MGHPDDSWKTVGREIWAKIKTGGGQGAGGGHKEPPGAARITPDGMDLHTGTKGWVVKSTC